MELSSPELVALDEFLRRNGYFVNWGNVDLVVFSEDMKTAYIYLDEWLVIAKIAENEVYAQRLD